jgi:hypothetical protein
MIAIEDFEPIDPIPAGDVASYRARSKTTSASLVVHCYRDAAANQGEYVASQLRRFPPADRARILDFGRAYRLVFFVTTELPGNLNFPQWVRFILDPPESSKAVSPEAQPRPVPVERTPPEQSLRPEPIREEPQTAANKPGELTMFAENRRQNKTPPANYGEPASPVYQNPSETTDTTEEFNRHYRRGGEVQPSKPSPIPELTDFRAMSRRAAPQSDRPAAPQYTGRMAAPVLQPPVREARRPDYPPASSSRPMKSPAKFGLKPWVAIVGIILGVVLVLLLILRLMDVT